MNRSRHLPASVVLACLLSSGVAAAPTGPQLIQLPPRPLSDTLAAIGRVTGAEIMFTPESVEGLSAPAIDGSYTALQAVQLAVAGHALHADDHDGSILIRGRSETPAFETDANPPITVTGSRISGVPIASPLVRITQDDMRDAGKTSLADVIHDIPQNFNGGQSPGIGYNVPQASGSYVGGGTGLDLRGIGSDATLTLLDGQRLSYNGALQSIDISTIPLLLVDRIEIVPDGASALYGSDAVAGVANILLRHDMDGLVSSARVGGSTDGGNLEQQYDLGFGRRWRSGGFILAYDFAKDTAVNAADRSYAASATAGLTLYPSLRHHDVGLAAHQDLATNLSLSIDGLFNKRWMTSSYATNPAGDKRLGGGQVSYSDRSSAIAPTLAYQAGPWKLALSGSYGNDRAIYRNSSFSRGVNISESDGCYCNTANSVELNADGPVLRLPGGAVRLAVGGGSRINTLRAYRTVGPAQHIQASQRDSYGYAELNVPISTPSLHIPALYRLNISAAVRYDSYDAVGDVATPKLGMVWSPNADVDLKASWGKSFRAPTLYEQFSANSVTLGLANRYGGSGYGPGSTILFVQGSNARLKPEKATSWTISSNFHPRFLPGASLEVSFFHISYRDRVVQPITVSAQSLSNPIYRDLVNFSPTDAQKADIVANALNFTNSVGGSYNPGAVVAIINDAYLNVASQAIHGVDASAHYVYQLDRGRSLSFVGSASYLHSAQKLSALQPSTPLAGILFNPAHFRARAGLVWSTPAWTLSSYAHYTGPLTDTRTAKSVLVGSMTTWDVVGRYTLPVDRGWMKSVSLTLSATNTLDTPPPLIAISSQISAPFDSTNASPLGRVISFTVSKSW